MTNFNLKQVAGAVLVVLALLSHGLMQRLLAQGGFSPTQHETTQTVPIVSGKGTAKPMRVQPGPPPPVLTPTEKSKAFNGKQTAVYAKLTVNQPYLFKKAALSFFGTSQVNGGDNTDNNNEYGNLAVWPGQANPKSYQALLVSLKPAALGQIYALDLAVRASKKGDTFTVTGADGHKELFTATGDSQHLLIFLKADDPTLDEVTVTGSSSWTFYSCEITTM